MNRTWSPSLLEAVASLYDDSDRVLEMLGLRPPALPAEMRAPPEDTSADVLMRLRRLEGQLETYVVQMAAEDKEYGSAAERGRLQAEALGVLLALRELRRHVPELGSRDSKLTQA